MLSIMANVEQFTCKFYTQKLIMWVVDRARRGADTSWCSPPTPVHYTYTGIALCDYPLQLNSVCDKVLLTSNMSQTSQHISERNEKENIYNWKI